MRFYNLSCLCRYKLQCYAPLPKMDVWRVNGASYLRSSGALTVRKEHVSISTLLVSNVQTQVRGAASRPRLFAPYIPGYTRTYWDILKS